MVYHGNYTVKDSFILKGSNVIAWKITGSGEFIIGEKGGEEYFIKRNMHVRYPDKRDPKSVYDKYKAAAEYIEKKQALLKNKMKGLSCETDRVVPEEEYFWDGENMFVTVTRLIHGGLPDDHDYTKLTASEFIDMAVTAAQALKTLHSRGVIHGDLKEKNFVVTKKGGKYIPHIIDFDSSYATDFIPPWENIGGTEGYQSPEVIVYGLDENNAPPETITAATDIFSLGIVFHRWWTRAFPDIDMDRGTVGAAVCLGKRVTINKKFDTTIGDKTGATLRSLINWMLALEPTARPTAEQVVAVLRDELEVPDEFICGSDDKPFKAELWDIHARGFKLYGKDNLKYKKGIKAFKKVNDGTLKYYVKLADGSEKTLTVEQLCDAGYAERLNASVCEPWQEHIDIFEFVSAKKIAESGFIKIERTKAPNKKSYVLYKNTGLSFERDFKYLEKKGLIKIKKPKTVKIDADTPWPEHGSAYDSDRLAAVGVHSISKVEYGGEHRYKIIYLQEDGSYLTLDRVSANNVRIMGYIK